MAVDHYENFPVASVLLPKRLRRPVEIIYHFARQADDFADEGDIPNDERLAKLDAFRAELRRIEANEAPQTPLFIDVASIVSEFQLPPQLFHDLLDAFSQDVVKKRYADFDEVLDYCRRSANPVGRLLLHLYEEATPQNLIYSDQICTALQLINFWQDVKKDYAITRIYLPQDEMARHGVRGMHRAGPPRCFLAGTDAVPVRARAQHDAVRRAARQYPDWTNRPGDAHDHRGRLAHPRQTGGGEILHVQPPPGAQALGLGYHAVPECSIPILTARAIPFLT